MPRLGLLPAVCCLTGDGAGRMLCIDADGLQPAPALRPPTSLCLRFQTLPARCNTPLPRSSPSSPLLLPHPRPPAAPTPHTPMQRNVYVKGLVAEVAQFLFGDGFAITGGEEWRARRRAVGPSLHK